MTTHATRIGTPGPRPDFPGPWAVAESIRYERSARRRGRLPAGWTNYSTRRTLRMRRDPLGLLLDGYARFGPIFGIRVMHDYSAIMLGPEANHFVLVSGRDNFVWRHGRFGDLLTLLGDGLLTTDGDYHDAGRAIMLPAFHRDRIVAATELMGEEASAAVDSLPGGGTVDLFSWQRALAMRIAMRGLFGLDPDGAHAADLVDAFERGLRFHEREFPLQVLIGPGTPWAKLKRARADLERLLGAEIRRRRNSETAGEDILGSLLQSADQDGRILSDRQVLDHVLTLLFAGHDTTTSTVTFLVYELTRRPEWQRLLQAELDSVCGERPPSAEELSGSLPLLTQAIDETLRLYPPAWIGPRRAVCDFEFGGRFVPAGVSVAYSSWASHRLPDVFEAPDAFRPERFEPSERANWPRGAYVPFGQGPRVCIGKRFGYTEVHAVAAALLQRYDLELEPGYQMQIRQMPTLSPKHGLPIRLRRRGRGLQATA